MKIFVYKSLFTFFLLLILFKLTIGKLISNYEQKIDYFLSKEYTNQIKSKIRKEIKSGIEKEKILSSEDAMLINKFLEKLKTEISNADK
tara:strand:+ start:50 stop:316 length:267 start_codon:yes stop_codon:yes gene_type:complete